MKILFVAFANSIHTARWINQIADQGWDVRLLPSTEARAVHPALSHKVRVYPMVWPLLPLQARVPKLYREYKVRQLEAVIRSFKPDIVHSMEFQHSCYLALDARQRISTFPPWIVQNWGSDIYLFGKQDGHREKIKDILEQADYYGCETQRDVELARLCGFKGMVLPVLPNTGGLDLGFCHHYGHMKASIRRAILLKGYQGWAGRALVGLRAIELCASELRGYHVVIYSAQFNRSVIEKAVQSLKGLQIIISPYMTHQNTLKLYGESRVYIGLSISDAIPTSLTEAMAMGAYPIQSNTGAANEWLDGSGAVVPPEDVGRVAAALRLALKDDTMVDRAQVHNWRIAQERLDERLIRPRVIRMYEEVRSDTLRQES